MKASGDRIIDIARGVGFYVKQVGTRNGHVIGSFPSAPNLLWNYTYKKHNFYILQLYIIELKHNLFSSCSTSQSILPQSCDFSELKGG